MRKFILLSALCAGTFTQMNAQSIEPSLGLGALASGNLKLETMYHFEPEQSVNLELRLINNSITSDDGTVDTRLRGIAISPEYMYYFSPGYEDNSRWYIGPYLRFKSMSSEGWQEMDLNTGNMMDADFSQLAFGFGSNLGYHLAIPNGLTFRFYMGAGWNAVNQITQTDGYESLLSAGYGVPFHVRSGINVGFRF